MVRKGNKSNPVAQQRWQLNPNQELDKLKRAVFSKLADTKLAYNKAESATANMANLGLVYKLDDKERSLFNYKHQKKMNEKLHPDAPAPTPFNITVPESDIRTEPAMMHEWDYDYCGTLVKAHGTNYKVMSRDLRRNYRQKSEAELRKLCEKYIEFKAFGEQKLKGAQEAIKHQEAQDRQGTILGAPESIVNNTNKTHNNTTDNDAKTKRKRADEAADSKVEENTNNEKDTTNGQTKDKQTPAKKAKKEETKKEETPAKKAKKEETKKEETPAKKGKKEEPAKKEKKEVAKTSKKEETQPKKQDAKAVTKTQTDNKAATKAQTTDNKQKKVEKVEPKKVEKKVEKKAEKKVEKKVEKKGKKEGDDEEDSDLEGMEFDFNEGDLSSDDE